MAQATSEDIDWNEVYAITRNARVDPSVGRIDALQSSSTERSVFITGHPASHPEFIGETDKKLWYEHWNKAAHGTGIKGLNYTDNGAFTGRFFGPQYDEIRSGVETIHTLLGRHRLATQTYNRSIAAVHTEAREAALAHVFDQ